MKVTLKEIRRLQEDITDEIDSISDDPDVDYDLLTELRTVNFNITMLFLRYSMEKDTTVIELDDNSDIKIIEALKPRRKHISTKKGTTDAFISHITPLLQNLLNDIDDLRSTLPGGSRNYLSRNIDAQLIRAKEPIEKIISLEADEETFNLWKKSLISSAASAASTMGKTRTEKKAAAARENGRKGGRPRKEAVKKNGSSKTSKKTASKPTTKNKPKTRQTEKKVSRSRSKK